MTTTDTKHDTADRAATRPDGEPASHSSNVPINVPVNVPVNVSIYDQVYHLRGTDPAHIEQLAALVDGKMRAVSAQGHTVDSLRVAVLAALNIADELAILQARYQLLAGSMENSQTTQQSLRSRAGTLSGMLDEVLSDSHAVRRAG